jgi:hypothetical protein
MLFEVERARVAGLPRVLLALGAVALLWSGAVRTIQALTIYQASKLREQLDDSLGDPEWWSPPTAWTVIGPIVAPIGGFLVALALRAQVHRMTADGKARAHATLMAAFGGVFVGISSIITVVAPRYPLSKLQLPAQIAAAILAAGSLVAVAAIARTLSRLHDEQPALPTARLRS